MISNMLSSDTHVIEPPDLWTSRVSPEYRDQAPRVERVDDADWWIIDGGPCSTLDRVLEGCGDSLKFLAARGDAFVGDFSQPELDDLVRWRCGRAGVTVDVPVLAL
jgi:hypothetical protein